VQLVTIDDIRAAAELIRPYIVRTPLVPAGWADDERPLWIKPENLQQIGAFKVRGAFNAIAKLDESVRTRGVVAYSSGNHAQAVAYTAYPRTSSCRRKRRPSRWPRPAATAPR
jgi:threonine dehydratase